MRTKNVAFFIIFISIMMSSLPMFGWSFFSRTPEPAAIVKTTPLIRFTMLIDPARNTRDGVEIDGIAEHLLTMEFAQALKKEIEDKTPDVRILLTRTDNEIVEPLHNASLANRHNVDLYISLHFFSDKGKTRKLFMYRSLYNPTTEKWNKKSDELALIPFNQAYRLHLTESENFSALFYEEVKKAQELHNVTTPLSIHRPLGVPYKPLVGITAPAFGIEIGMRKKDDWKELVPLISHALHVIGGTQS